MAIVAIIPARFGSVRLPGKPLSDIHGKPLIQHVHERATRARGLDRVLVATDDERIIAAVRAFGGEAVMTSSRHATGTDRLAEAVTSTDASVVVNVQGDEPMLDPRVIEAVLVPFNADRDVVMATAALPLGSAEEMASPHVVKVVCDGRGNALYFSRSPVPWVRGEGGEDLRASCRAAVAAGLAWKHVGVYAYRRETLLRLASLPPAPLEQAESLEQLRALHHGIPIRVVPLVAEPGLAVDTPEDLERVRVLLDPRRHEQGA